MSVYIVVRIYCKRCDINIDRETGFVKPKRGISVNSDATKVARFGRVSRVDSIPDELMLKQIGLKGHDEIIPKVAMPKERYIQLIGEIKYTYI